MTVQTTVLFHGNCPDGTAASSAARRARRFRGHCSVLVKG